MKKLIAVLLMASLAMVALAESPSLSPSAPDGLRDGGTLGEVGAAPPIAGDPREVKREVRNYPEQPPVIPHNIRGYQVDKRFNRCLDCHSRQAAPSAGAPMVSVTHFMDRNFQVRAEVTPGRYFCTQCHVPQTDAEALMDSDFKPIDQVIREGDRGESQ
ncbi:cytochrome C [Marinobacter vulgaris]|uniref:Periplasmic nitrate reductase, electron transfer subunit n=1 Tax=Marinobacter vulgaris TaxID=1928331 RepID=A0A2V3ZXA5_9GAMM|nr:nitrate reductase cytochrome c-type subunit [Marinobacter vulgaris]PXX90302.1 cytochrome C [Marinobacter vulgaris]TSJ69674.1 nitrate reductase cytochrome c-type subunit [Marinobacter vulgaris]